MATAAQIQANIDALNDAKLQLGLGKLTISILFDNRQRMFAKTDMASINGLLMEQRAMLAQITGAAMPSRARRVQF